MNIPYRDSMHREHVRERREQRAAHHLNLYNLDIDNTITYSSDTERNYIRNIMNQPPDMSGIIHRSHIFRIEKSRDKTFKHTFCNDTDEECSICCKVFKQNDVLCINACYHYWCVECEKNFKRRSCPYCKVKLSKNVFLASNGKSGVFTKTEHSVKTMNILSKDGACSYLCIADDEKPGDEKPNDELT